MASRTEMRIRSRVNLRGAIDRDHLHSKMVSRSESLLREGASMALCIANIYSQVGLFHKDRDLFRGKSARDYRMLLLGLGTISHTKHTIRYDIDLHGRTERS